MKSEELQCSHKSNLENQNNYWLIKNSPHIDENQLIFKSLPRLERTKKNCIATSIYEKKRRNGTVLIIKNNNDNN